MKDNWDLHSSVSDLVSSSTDAVFMCSAGWQSCNLLRVCAEWQHHMYSLWTKQSQNSLRWAPWKIIQDEGLNRIQNLYLWKDVTNGNGEIFLWTFISVCIVMSFKCKHSCSELTWTEAWKICSKILVWNVPEAQNNFSVHQDWSWICVSTVLW